MVDRLRRHGYASGRWARLRARSDANMFERPFAQRGGRFGAATRPAGGTGLSLE
jgi:hypothetical protein